MKKSLFTTLDVHPDFARERPSRYSEALRQATLAEQLGFDGFWVGEHHFRAVGTIPNPAVLLAAIAARTDRIRLGPAVSVLALRDPILIAEDYAMLDVLSGGRLNMGVGTGSSAEEFEGFDLDFEGRRESFAARLSTLLRRWETFGDSEREVLNVRPVQSPPPIYIATSSPDVARATGRAGHSLLALASPSTRDLEELRVLLEAHGEGREQSDGPRSAEAVLTFFTHVGSTEERALREASAALARFLDLAQGAAPRNARSLCQAMKDRGTGLFGTGDQVRGQLHRIEDMGCRHVTFLANFGGLAASAVEESMRSLAVA